MNFKCSRYIFRLFFFMLGCHSGLTQTRPPAGVGGNGNSYGQTTTIDSTQEEAVVLDTAYITSFLPNNRGLVTLENDSLLDRNFQQYDPIRQRDNDYLNL